MLYFYIMQIIRTTDPESSARLPMEKEVVDYCERSIALRKKLTGDEHKVSDKSLISLFTILKGTVMPSLSCVDSKRSSHR